MAAVRTLVKQGHDVNAPGSDGATALHWSVRADDVEAVDALIRAGAKVGVANVLGVTPIYIAAENGNAAMLRRLLDAGADVNAHGRDGRHLADGGSARGQCRCGSRCSSIAARR